MAKPTTRLPLHRAPFYFAPRFLSTDVEWQEHFEKVARAVAGAENVSIDAMERYGDFALRVRCDDFWFVIEAQQGTFDCLRDNGFNTSAIWAGFAKDIPQRFIHQLTRSASSLALELCPNNIREQMLRFARGIYIQMQRLLESAFFEGVCHREARGNSENADFRSVAPDQLAYYDVIPWDLEATPRDALDTAVSKDGTSTLYSLCVVPTSPTNRADTSSAAIAPLAEQVVDGRSRKDKAQILAIISQEHAIRKLKPELTPEELVRATLDRMGGHKKPPSPGTIRKYIKELGIFLSD